MASISEAFSNKILSNCLDCGHSKDNHPFDHPFRSNLGQKKWIFPKSKNKNLNSKRCSLNSKRCSACGIPKSRHYIVNHIFYD